MSTEADLLAAIDAAPDDDAPRLAHAAWLEATGNPDRAEFIRLSLEPARMLDLVPNGQPMQRRNQLLHQHERAWLGKRPQHANINWRFVRGYPEAVAFFSVAAWKAMSREAFKHPVRLVALRALKDASRLAGDPGLARIRRLEWYPGTDVDGLMAVLHSPHLGPLEMLEVYEATSETVAR